MHLLSEAPFTPHYTWESIPTYPILTNRCFACGLHSQFCRRLWQNTWWMRLTWSCLFDKVKTDQMVCTSRQNKDQWRVVNQLALTLIVFTWPAVNWSAEKIFRWMWMWIIDDRRCACWRVHINTQTAQYPWKQDVILTQCWLNSGPASQTVGHHHNQHLVNYVLVDNSQLWLTHMCATAVSRLNNISHVNSFIMFITSPTFVSSILLPAV